MLYRICTENSGIRYQNIIHQTLKQLSFPYLVPVHDVVNDDRLIQIIQVLQDRIFIRKLNNLRKTAVYQIIRDGICLLQIVPINSRYCGA